MYALRAPAAEVASGRVRHPSLRLLDTVDGRLGDPVPLKAALRPVGELGGKLVLVEKRREGPDGVGFAGYSAVAVFDPRTGSPGRHALRGASGSAALVTEGAAPAVAAGALHFVEQSGRVHAVDPATGRVRWSRQTGVEWPSSPVASDGVLYLGSASGRVVALDTRTGDTRWASQPRVESPGTELGATARVTVVGRAVLVSAAGNTLFGFDSKRPPAPE